MPPITTASDASLRVHTEEDDEDDDDDDDDEDEEDEEEDERQEEEEEEEAGWRLKPRERAVRAARAQCSETELRPSVSDATASAA
eukprot:3305764-Rhodomonas_salina.1